jgi:hypothetical protein
VPPFGSAISATTTVRVIAAGGSATDPLPNDPPAVTAAQTVPKANATGVPVTIYPQVVFTEPVTHVPGHVTLTEAASGAVVPVMLLGVGPSGPVSVDSDGAVVTSLTIQPAVGLKYATRYRLSLTSDIVDTDTNPSTGAPAPKALAAYATEFTTFGPEAIGHTEEAFASPRIVIVDNRGYVATPVTSGVGSTRLRVFDVSDPVTPTEIEQASPRDEHEPLAPPRCGRRPPTRTGGGASCSTRTSNCTPRRGRGAGRRTPSAPRPGPRWLHARAPPAGRVRRPGRHPTTGSTTEAGESCP